MRLWLVLLCLVPVKSQTQCLPSQYEVAQTYESGCLCSKASVNLARSCSPTATCPTSYRGYPWPNCGYTTSNVATAGNDGNTGSCPMEIGHASLAPSGDIWGMWHWWRVDLGAGKDVSAVDIYQRSEMDQRRFLARFTLWLGYNSSGPNATGNVNCYSDTNDLTTILPTYQSVPCKAKGRYLFISQNATDKLGFNELEVYGCSASCNYANNPCSFKACTPSTYFSGNETCTPCPPNSYCPDGVNIVPCQELATSAVGSSVCTCQTGYFMNSSSQCQKCTECGTGKFVLAH